MSANAVIYARFSTLEQAKGYSLERQIQHGKAYVAQQNWTVDAIITDEGRSAFHGANRASGSALFQFEAEAREGLHRGKTLCVENIDRLSRQGAKAAAQLVWALNENGVDVATWQDGYVYRSGAAAGDMMELFSIIIKAQMAHEESLKKSQRTSASWQKRYAEIAAGNNSVLVGQTPAWIVEDKGRYVLHPARAVVLNEIFDLYISGIGIYRIVQILNERNEPSWTTNKRNRGGGWYLAYVHRLLTNRAVMGEYSTLNGELISANYWPPAITAHKFNKAAEQRGSRVSTGGGDRVRINNLLSGLVRCSCCHGPGGYENKGDNSFTKYTAKSGEVRLHKRKHYERLRCDANRRRKGCSNSTLFDYKVVEASVLDRVLSLAVSEEGPRDELPAIELAEAQRQIQANRMKLDNLVDALADGGSKAIVARVAALEQEIEAQEAALLALKELLAIASVQPSYSDDIALVQSLRGDLVSKDVSVRFYARTRVNQALKRVVDRIDLNEDGTFSVLSSMAVWVFNGEGEVIAGQAI